ncbi:hypothetical protein [Streptomyces sp. NPDC051214]|uniref:hypothetical protein n=1 Tax=Streptomyces sp. NPDC051214 TaxID=3155282 RepID=UPI00342D1489
MQGTPHIASTPNDGRLPSVSPYPPGAAAPAARRPTAAPFSPAAAPQLPVFIDRSGWRRRTLQGVGLIVGCGCLGYLLFAGTLISGLWQPVGTHPPSTDAPASSDAGTPGETSAGTSAGSSRADPAAGGPKQ